MDNNILSFLNSDFFISSLQAFALTIFGAWVWDTFLRVKRRYSTQRADRKSQKSFASYNPADDGLIKLNQWSLSHPLKRRNHKVIVDPQRPSQGFIPSEKLTLESEKLQKAGYSGDICYLTGVQIDHNESVAGRVFSLKVTPCDYSEHIAACKIVGSDDKTRNEIISRMRDNPFKYLSNPVPSNIFVNVVVLSRENFLAVRRSRSVETAKDEWVPGVAETMKIKIDLPGDEEDLFTLSRRCLKEELNLDEDMYGEINIAWFGLSELTLGAIAIAVVELKDDITEMYVEDLASNSHSSYEQDGFKWFPLNEAKLTSFIDGTDKDLSNMRWINFTKKSLIEALRFKTLFRL
ncbi:hypothetical protein ACPUEK_15935 [Marinomonas gallaica]|uniref:hypothetical protein n=1 Tax=Marinomonas gallaica TaxID=1806667 RepID=UPI003CE52306